ncbi:MAG: hypothetical protein VR69_05775 [Peptococcaceae bacterium BRH_c4b]|nr:MAG: hypothetical protein VR69_05775 [Peptococcaceae bacterium BRH_c4b]
MKCINHSELEAVDICKVCRQPVCDQCIVTLGEKNYCRTCLEKKVASIPESMENKSRFIAFILSLIPGCGYLYLGLMKRGLQAMLVFFGTIFFSAMLQMDVLTALVLPVIFFYTVFDTQQFVKRINQGYHVEDKELFDWGLWENKSNIIGAILILLGIMALANNFIPYVIPYGFIRNVFPPLLIVGIGIYILYRNAGQKGKGADDNGNQKPED